MLITLTPEVGRWHTAVLLLDIFESAILKAKGRKQVFNCIIKDRLRPAQRRWQNVIKSSNVLNAEIIYYSTSMWRW